MLSPLAPNSFMLCVSIPMNVLPYLVFYGCETRARSRSDNFTVHRMEELASNTHISSFV